jgi:hypothetical protein
MLSSSDETASAEEESSRKAICWRILSSLPHSLRPYTKIIDSVAIHAPMINIMTVDIMFSYLKPTRLQNRAFYLAMRETREKSVSEEGIFFLKPQFHGLCSER